MFLGDKEITGIYLGDKEITGSYLGDDEVWSGKEQLKYVFTIPHSNETGTIPCTLKKYKVSDGELLGTYNLNYVTWYSDECISIDWNTLCGYRYTITIKVDGDYSNTGVHNYGTDYGGTSNQYVPYTQSQTYSMTFVTHGKYKV